MKRSLIFTIALIFLISFVSSVDAAIIEFGSGLNGQYNLGDTIDVDGKVTSQTAKSGQFKLQVYCNNQASNIVKSKYLNLEAGGEYVFTETMMLPVNVEGKCYVQGGFDDAKVSSSSFMVAKELKGVFDISDSSLQLGEGFTLYGKATRLNDILIDGIATISINDNSGAYDVNTVNIEKGGLNYSYRAENIPAGRYYVNVNVMDVFGNEKLFSNVAGFDVYNELKISAVVDKLEILPGGGIVVYGEVRYKNGDLVDDKTRLWINNELVGLKDGVYRFTINTAGNIKSGQNDVSLKASDEHGNLGEGLMSFRVIPVATRLVVNKNKQEYYPRDTLEINSYLYDQAGEIMENDAVITLKNPEGDAVEQSVGGFVYNLGEQAMPGVWRVIAKQDKLEVDEEIVVKELANLSIVLSGQDVFIKNIGNVDFEDNAVVRVDNEILNQPLQLGLNETYTIELDRFNGERNVSVFALGREFYLGRLNIEDRRTFFGKIGDQLTGNVVSSEEDERVINPWIYVSVLVVLVGIVAGFYIYKKRSERYYDGLRNMDKKEAARYAERIRKGKEKETPKRKFYFGGKPMKDEDVKDFREQMVGRIQEEEKKNRGAYSSRNRDENERPRMMG